MGAASLRVCPHRSQTVSSRSCVAAAGGSLAPPPSPAAQAVRERRALLQEQAEAEENDGSALPAMQLWSTDDSSMLESDPTSWSECDCQPKMSHPRIFHNHQPCQNDAELGPPPWGTATMPTASLQQSPGLEVLEAAADLDAWYRAASVDDAARCLSSSSAAVTKLALVGVTVSDEEVGMLSRGLFDNTRVMRLSLDQCKISDHGAEQLAEALSENDTLTALSLEGNRVGDRGAGRLAAALHQNEALTSLSLGRNRVGGQGCKHLADALEVNYALRMLDLSSNSGSLAGWSYTSDGRARATANKRIQALLQRNRAPRKVITLRASLLSPPESPPSSPEAEAIHAKTSGAALTTAPIQVSCTTMAGTDLAELALEPEGSVKELRQEIATRLGIPKPRFVLLLPDGRMLTKADDPRQLIDVFFAPSSCVSAAGSEAGSGDEITHQTRQKCHADLQQRQ
eukprot:TRINITY_DN27844_c0_g1_i1.p1 TRINITY_DN27844_c0_g1~~TRINITY_DN27844_c0_g1_i1.p1  ORF type:complete len:456 (-),score=78.36 TRINITY_DN27844_c0_g1_i1:27-1394(-)